MKQQNKTGLNEASQWHGKKANDIAVAWKEG